MTDRSALYAAWWTALGWFVIAGATGALYRLGLAYGTTFGLDLVNIRHAHSHLMYFGWVTPALMALIAARLGETRRVRGIRLVLVAAFVAAFVAFPLFLSFGYRSVAIGDARMPLSVIAAGFNIFAWYGFVWVYARTTSRAPRTRQLVLWDVALSFLVLATVGAWGLSLLKPLGIEGEAITSGLTHVFLDLFSEGWFVLAVLGLAYAALGREGERGTHWSIALIAIGLPVTFALGMPQMLVPQPLQALARGGGVLVGAGLLVNVAILWPRALRAGRRLWLIPLAMLAVKAGAEITGSLVTSVWWPSQPGLRVLYLHVMLLGFVSLGLVAASSGALGRRAAVGGQWFYAAVVVLLASLVPLTPAWPAAWRGAWILPGLAWIAVLPVLAVIGMIVRQLILNGYGAPESGASEERADSRTQI